MIFLLEPECTGWEQLQRHTTPIDRDVALSDTGRFKTMVTFYCCDNTNYFARVVLWLSVMCMTPLRFPMSESKNVATLTDC